MTNTGFSDVYLRSLPLPEKGQRAYWDGKLPGFGIRVSQGGSKTFVLNRQNNLITIGRFGILSLAEARTEARKLLAEFTLGKVRPQSITFPQALKLFLEEKRRTRRPRTVADYDYLLNRLPFKTQLTDITHDDFRRALNRYKAEATRNHAIVAAKIFFTWCVRRRYLTDNPTTGFTKPPSTTRARVLTDQELLLIWEASGKLGNFGVIVRLLVATGQRRGEIAALKPSWIDLENKTLTIPASITKNGRQHTFPIGSLSMSLLNPLVSSAHDFLFPARGQTSKPFNGWSKSKAALDNIISSLLAKNEQVNATPVQPWTLHDLRRTYATNMARLGVPIHIIERLLNHVSGSFGGIVGVYQRHQFWDEQVQAIEKWEAQLDGLFGKKPPAEAG